MNGSVKIFSTPPEIICIVVYTCVRTALGISKQRIARQRAVKRQQNAKPIVKMSKSDVEKQDLSTHVVMPSSVEEPFNKWWRALEATSLVDVRYPHERHGNAGKPSNSARTSVKEDFIRFVDMNSQPNGCSQDSSGPRYYFLSKFTTIQTPKPESPNYEQRLRSSVVNEFNRSQREAGKQGCSNGSSANWLKLERPKHAICPHQEDYCDTCAKAKETIRGKQTTLNRLKQAAASTPEDLFALEDEIQSCQATQAKHREEACESHAYFMECTKKCSTQWKRITELETKSSLADDEIQELASLKKRFELLVSADYQMSKLIPFWGQSSQPGSTYYLQKLSHDVFGLVNHASDSSMVCIFDERVGPKNTDHTLSYMTHYLNKMADLPAWVRRIHIFLDNTVSTNKNRYTMSWASEMVQQDVFEFIRISFMIAGHTKFSPDHLFARISKSFNCSDVFTAEELKEIAAPYADVIIDNGEVVVDWRNSLSAKYKKFPGIRSYHDFVFAKNITTQHVMVRQRRLCYTGAFETMNVQVVTGQSSEDDIIPGADKTYLALNNCLQSRWFIFVRCILSLFLLSATFLFCNSCDNCTSCFTCPML